MTKATTNGITLAAYIADTVIPHRSDILTLELRTSNPETIIGDAREGPFKIHLLDADGKPVPRLEKYEAALDSRFPGRHDRSYRPVRHLPLPVEQPLFERFNLADRYQVRPGENYVLSASVQVRTIGSDFQELRLQEFPIAVEEIPFEK